MRKLLVALAVVMPVAWAGNTWAAEPAAGSEVRDWRYVLTIHEIAGADDDARLATLVGDNPDRMLTRLPDGRTVTHVAAEVGALKSLRVLGKAGADLNVVDVKGHTPLSVAIGSHFSTTVKTLVELGVDVNREGAIEEERPMPPLVIAMRLGYADIVTTLLAAKANVDQIASDGSTPLTAGAANGRVEAVTFLLGHGAKTDGKNREGTTALLLAVRGGHGAVVKALLDAKADVNLAGPDGNTPLMAAVRGGFVDIVKVLLEASANANAVAPDGNTPLTAAAVGKHWDIAGLLLEHGANVNGQDRDGVTALIQAASQANETAVGMLLEKGADAKLADKRNRTPLSLTQSPTLWKMLVAKGADVNATVQGATPLQHFITDGNLALVKAWLEYKPDPMVPDRKGATAKELARQFAGAAVVGDRREIVKLLETYQSEYYAAHAGK